MSNGYAESPARRRPVDLWACLVIWSLTDFTSAFLIFSLHSILKERKQAYGITVLRVCVRPFSFWTSWPDFRRARYERNAAGDHLNLVFPNFLQLLTLEGPPEQFSIKSWSDV
jgi:hypothetical protein